VRVVLYSLPIVFVNEGVELEFDVARLLLVLFILLVVVLLGRRGGGGWSSASPRRG